MDFSLLRGKTQTSHLVAQALGKLTHFPGLGSCTADPPGPASCKALFPLQPAPRPSLPCPLQVLLPDQVWGKDSPPCCPFPLRLSYPSRLVVISRELVSFPS